MSTNVSGESGVDNDPRLSGEERSLYRLLAYFLVSWVLLSELGRRLLPEYVGPALATFVVILGSWFVEKSRRRNVSFATWLGISVLGSVSVAGLLYVVNRLWPVV